jgi:NAD(P)-dependent dehydrogenase (short-subunit alcohol dehydrogenase family)
MARVFAVNTDRRGACPVAPAAASAEDGRSVTGVLTARVGSIGDNRIGGWHSYRASKAALNQIVHGAGIELGRTHRDAVIAALHPGTVATPFTEGYEPKHGKVTPEEAAKEPLRRDGAADAGAVGRLLRLCRAGDPVVSRLVLILGDQLSDDIAALREADRETDVVVMAEVMDEASYVPTTPRRSRSSSPPCANSPPGWKGQGWTVRYTRLDDPDNAGSIPGELLRAAEPPARPRCWRPNPASSA